MTAATVALGRGLADRADDRAERADDAPDEPVELLFVDIVKQASTMLAERIDHPTLRGTVELAAVFLAKLTDPTLYRHRLERVRDAVHGPRLERFLAEVEAADALGALRPGAGTAPTR